LQGCPFLPGLDLGKHGVTFHSTDEQMHVVGHDDVVTVASVEMGFKLRGEGACGLLTLRFREAL
jgi:hypothetical protein